MELPPPGRWNEINALLAEAQSAEDPEAFLASACENDEALRREVETLLDAAATYGSLIDDGAAALAQPILTPSDASTAESAPLQLAAGEKVGSYRLIDQLGEGGTSVVYRAERADDQFERTVAIKVLRGVLEQDGGTIERFRAERQILASLSHPHLADVYDGGVLPDGRPYLVMEHVDGRFITEHCRAENCSLEQRMSLFRQAAEAVQAAHEQLVVHRDIKPTNVLVERETGQVKLLDFGIAKILGEMPGGPVPATETGRQPMTPAYAAPEQVKGEPISVATDTYALGVLLYELLTDSRPYGSDEQSPYAVARAVCDEEPTLPSEQADHERRTALKGDLDAIVMTALRKAPADRYNTVDDLVHDLERYRGDRPVQAQQGSWGYRARKFARRHRWSIGTGTLVMLLVAGFVGLLLHQQAVTERQRDRARVEAQTATQLSNFLVGLFEAGNPYEADSDTLTVRDLLERGQRRIEELRGQPAVRSRLLEALGEAHHGLGNHREADSLLRSGLALAREREAGRAPQARLHHALGGLRADNYEWTRALRHHRRARARLRDKPRPLSRSDSLLLADVLPSLGRAYRNVGTLDSAETAVRRAVDLRRSVLGPDHEKTWGARASLAYVLRESDAPAEAARLYRKVLAWERDHADSLDVASTLNNLGYLHRKQGNLGRAERRYEEALSIYEQQLGPAHPSTLVVRGNNLSFVYALQDEYPAAEQVLREQLRAIRNRYAPGHWRVGKWAYMLGENLLFQGENLAEAEVLLREGVRVYDQSDQAGRVSMLRHQAVLGHALEFQGNVRQARPLLRRSYAVLSADSVNAPLYRAHAEVGLGLYHTDRGRYPRAESLLTAAHTRLDSLYHGASGVDSTVTPLPPVQQVRRHLRRLYETWAQPKSAERYRSGGDIQ